MSEAEDVARRFIALWGDYLTALAADPKTAEPIRRWLGLLAAAMPDPPAREATKAGRARSPSRAAAAAGPSAGRDDIVAELARRVDELETRLAALERRRKPAGPARSGTRTARR
jgi:hypothetical protein